MVMEHGCNVLDLPHAGSESGKCSCGGNEAHANIELSVISIDSMLAGNVAEEKHIRDENLKHLGGNTVGS